MDLGARFTVVKTYLTNRQDFGKQIHGISMNNVNFEYIEQAKTIVSYVKHIHGPFKQDMHVSKFQHRFHERQNLQSVVWLTWVLVWPTWGLTINKSWRRLKSTLADLANWPGSLGREKERLWPVPQKESLGAISSSRELVDTITSLSVRFK